MASVSYNGQSFIIDGRRLWILAASIQYARVAPDEWADRIAAARQAGFNTIETACPWNLHEPRRGKPTFTEAGDVGRFIDLCGEAGMRVIVRAGPYVGAGFDGGGLPSWLVEDESIALREADQAFVRLAGRFLRKLSAELVERQATRGGPVLLVQIEHEWTCANDVQAEKYLREIGRIVREAGINVPLINGNNLWADAVDTIDTWRGHDDLLANLRQLRTVQSDAPRLVALTPPGRPVWGAAPDTMPGPVMMRRLAEILAAGAQPIVAPFHGGTYFGFGGGRRPGPGGGAVTTAGAAGAPLGEAGARGDAYHQVRRIVSFADAFGHVFADLDPDYHPITIDPATVEPRDGAGARRAAGKRAAPRVTIAPLLGAGGRVVFVFADGPGAETTLLLDGGVRLPVALGAQTVGWYVMGADIHGQGRLDFSNLCGHAIVDRRIVVLHGPAKTAAYLSVNGTPLQTTVPGGAKPTVVEHKGLVFVICNREQIDETYHDGERVYVGIAGFDAAGAPIAAHGRAKAYVISADGSVESMPMTGAKSGPARTRSSKLGGWTGVGADAYVAGESPRFASLPGPQSLPACGAPTGYGWYRLTLKSTAAKKRHVHAPCAGVRTHLYLDGDVLGVVGDGPGVRDMPIDLALAKGPHVLTALVDNQGRLDGGNDHDRFVGLYGHLYDVKRMTGKPKMITADPVDPFAVRGFIAGAAVGQPSDAEQVAWAFAQTKKNTIIIDVADADARGTFVLNDVPVAYFAGATGARRMRLRLDHADVAAMKRGKSTLRFAPDVGQPDACAEIAGATTLYECVEVISATAAWAFAKWETPAASKFEALPANGPRTRKLPWWWRCSFDTPRSRAPLWFDTHGLTKGQVFINGENLGRYFTALPTGRAVGPQTRLYIPRSRLRDSGKNDLLVFDEHGASPLTTRLVFNVQGDLD